MSKKIFIGSNVSYTKPDYCLGIIKQMVEYKATSATTFLGSPRSRFRIEDPELLKIKEAKELAKKHNIDIKNIMGHGPYIVNPAKDIIGDNWDFGIKIITKDVKIAHAFGMIYYNFHPGSNPDKKGGILLCAKAINKIHENTKDSNVVLLIETMMKKGNYIGINFKELSQIIEQVENKERVGICLDTCHIWDGGYDVKNNFDDVLDEFDKTIGLKYLKTIHLNDSLNERGSNKDRHANIGKGMIGLEALQNILYNPRLNGIPMAIESPCKPNACYYKEEIESLRNKK